MRRGLNNVNITFIGHRDFEYIVFTVNLKSWLHLFMPNNCHPANIKLEELHGQWSNKSFHSFCILFSIPIAVQTGDGCSEREANGVHCRRPLKATVFISTYGARLLVCKFCTYMSSWYFFQPMKLENRWWWLRCSCSLQFSNNGKWNALAYAVLVRFWLYWTFFQK